MLTDAELEHKEWLAMRALKQRLGVSSTEIAAESGVRIHSVINAMAGQRTEPAKRGRILGALSRLETKLRAEARHERAARRPPEGAPHER
jgi:hypothetical protein